MIEASQSCPRSNGQGEGPRWKPARVTGWGPALSLTEPEPAAAAAPGDESSSSSRSTSSESEWETWQGSTPPKASPQNNRG